MATRRNVPSKDVFRVIKTILNKSIVNSSISVKDARLLLRSRQDHENASVSAPPSPGTVLLHSSVCKQSLRQSLCPSKTCHKPNYRSASSFKSYSTSSKWSNVTSARLSPCLRILEQEEEPQHTRVEPPFHSQFDLPCLDNSRANLKQENGRTEYKDGSHETAAGTPLELESPEAAAMSRKDSDEAILLVPPYLAPDQPVPAYTPRRANFHREKRHNNLDPRHDYLYSLILLARDSKGYPVALQVAESVLRSYVDTMLEKDWELAKGLYMALCNRFIPRDLRVIRNSFIRSMLQENPPRLEAVSLLLEPNEPGPRISAKHVRSYLADFCGKISNPDLQLAEAEKVLQGMPKADEHSTAVVLPLIRCALEANDPDRARDLVARLSQTYALSIDFHVLSDLVKAYAKNGDWSATDALLDDLHYHGYSRSKPYAFAALVRTVYHYSAAVRLPNRMFDFLTYSMRNQGLVPTTLLSVSVIKDFIGSKRYDLLQRFVQVRQLWFPNILNSMDTPLAAYEIGEAWTHSAASPSEVLSTCKALACSSVRDPFSNEFQHMTNSYLLGRLYRLTKSLTVQVAVPEYMLDLKNFTSLEAMFKCTDRFISMANDSALNTRQSLMVDGYRKQIEAARQADHLVNHFHDFIQHHGTISKIEMSQTQPQRLYKRVQLTAELPEDTLALPGHDLAKVVVDLYQDTKPPGGHDKRGIVIAVMRYLQHHQRHRDCTLLVRRMWNSGSIKGAFLTHEILKCWVRMAYELRDARTLYEALWAAVDADPIQTTGYRFLMLVRAAVSVIMEEVHNGRLKQYPNQLEELKYLVSRCYRRRWQQDGCPKAEDITDPYLKKWRLEQDSVENDVSRIRSVFVY